jgi:hypothetical protein
MHASLRRMVFRTVTTLGASLAFLQTYTLPFAWNVGPGGRFWERLRRFASRLLGRVFDERTGPRPATAGEYAGRVDASLDRLEAGLWEAGFVRNSFARLKVREGEVEVGSWVYREAPLARRQLHLMLFRRDDGGVDVYAHEEASNVNPLVGWDHFDADRQDVAAGVERARAALPLDTSEATVEPVAGAWTAQPDVDRAQRC